MTVACVVVFNAPTNAFTRRSKNQRAPVVAVCYHAHRSRHDTHLKIGEVVSRRQDLDQLRF